MGANTQTAACVIQIDSPLGPVTIAANQKSLLSVCLGEDGAAKTHERLEHWNIPITDKATPAAKKTERELKQYFAGKNKRFTVPVEFHGPAFHQEVWTALKEVPFGEVLSYGELAELAGRPFAARAVGQAMANNNIPIVVPCHRVIGSSGKLHGFTGGLHIKEHLLKHEGVEVKR
ncbi:MAG: methylated-DNA--[protein]-cysteine S-methyltransferase [Candidatus Hinthialibacter antarcticus]|nr:methylated-DNA--[protein]-cysteine S-methyltransferase [Candidatus Hinthialibacter antarcticus]